ncbi:hypothetical protein JOY44_00975 [Phormidium sp. CLA17]|uniref:DALR anticodon-binding domain-containing protein n=1 Tax=Leptolyngbya sp. Cla-17 TaxID=2803751 RepID=UPI001491956A|nr:DALR anticodon-binding domain-containing protein [Leptolyngbya sp. Cla-17]MBM0740229.1 hypothetical protein [Leptolyngbya sp. Cla-17]
MNVSVCKSDYTCSQLLTELEVGLLDYVEIQSTPSGYLEFRIGESAIAQWLTCLNQPIASLFVSADPHSSFLTAHSQPAKRSHLSLFSIQHAHARCCSLLRLATQQEMIRLNWLEDASQWQWAQPNPIPWLTGQQLRTCTVAERQLISQCFTVWDELPWQADTLAKNSQPLSLYPSRITILAQGLAQAFYATHQQCQIWGALENEGSDRLIAHLALILVTQKLLYGLLRIELGVVAPEEL